MLLSYSFRISQLGICIRQQVQKWTKWVSYSRYPLPSLSPPPSLFPFLQTPTPLDAYLLGGAPRIGHCKEYPLGFPCSFIKQSWFLSRLIFWSIMVQGASLAYWGRPHWKSTELFWIWILLALFPWQKQFFPTWLNAVKDRLLLLAAFLESLVKI